MFIADRDVKCSSPRLIRAGHEVFGTMRDPARSPELAALANLELDHLARGRHLGAKRPDSPEEADARGPGRQPSRRATTPKVRVRNPLPATNRDAPAKPDERLVRMDRAVHQEPQRPASLDR